MLVYEEIYQKAPSEKELNDMKKKIADDEGTLAWEEYYWYVKCLCKFDEECSPEIVLKTANLALKMGLTYQVNKEKYLEIIKILATLNSQLSRYELVLNYLQTLLELDSDAPDWVYHDFVTSQMSTSSIRRMLKKPKMFLGDLARNDSNLTSTKRKQINILKEFFSKSANYLLEHSDTEIAWDELETAAKEYKVIDSLEWKQLLAAKEGKQSDIIANTDATEPDRPLVVQIFDEDPEKEELKKKYEELSKKFSEREEELLMRQKQIDDSEKLLLKLQEENEKLNSEIESQRNAVADYEKKLAKNETIIEDMKIKLNDAANGTVEQRELQKKICDAEAQQRNLLEKHSEMEEQLKSTTEKLSNAAEQIRVSALENRKLKEEIEKIKHEKEASSESSGGYSADIVSHFSAYLFSTTNLLSQWLRKRLPMCMSDWWNDGVLNSLSYEQRERAHDGRFSSLEELDLAALLRVISKNWQRLGSNTYLSHSDKECMSTMFDVRNRWAHVNSELHTKEEIVSDLATIAKFLSFLGCKSDIEKEISRYAAEVGKMTI